LPADIASQPEVVNLALMIARGMGTGTSAAGEPLHTEGAGGGRGTGPALSPMERAAARSRGLSDADWIKTRDAKDDSNLLE
jgi:hypothetical protein